METRLEPAASAAHAGHFRCEINVIRDDVSDQIRMMDELQWPDTGAVTLKCLLANV